MYVQEPCSIRNYLAGVLENSPAETVIDHLLTVVDVESDWFLRGQLGIALSAHFDERGVAAARRLYDEFPHGMDRFPIVGNLFALATLAELDLPTDDWEGLLEEERRGIPPGMGDVSIKPIPTPLDSPLFDSAESGSYNPTTITREVRIGRNDPCPCGSGKKYKKCCLNV